MQNITSTPSLARLIRQLCYIPCLSNRWLTLSVKDALTHAITQAEQGHRGEICLVIESHLPIASAYHQGCRQRALDLFGLYRVWDTAENTGVLIYVNLCEHELEIIADRGINNHTTEVTWQDLCHRTLIAFKNRQMQDGLTALITDVGEILRLYYPAEDIQGNELPDEMVYLK